MKVPAKAVSKKGVAVPAKPVTKNRAEVSAKLVTKSGVEVFTKPVTTKGVDVSAKPVTKNWVEVPARSVTNTNVVEGSPQGALNLDCDLVHAATNWFPAKDPGCWPAKPQALSTSFL